MSRAELKVASVNGTAINFVSQALKFLMQFCYQILVARLLLPEDFGIVAMAAPLFAFAALFSDFGLTQATVQRDEIDQEQLSFVFWVNVGLSAAICLAVIVLAPVAGVFFREPRIVPIVAGLSATFVIGGLCAQHLALLNRQLLFAKIALVELVSFLAGSVTCLLFAWNGFGYWALVYSQIATALTTLLLAWWFAKWVPEQACSAKPEFPSVEFWRQHNVLQFPEFFSPGILTTY
ncbi:oligosaccharide flippase family protein [Mesorhizobium atlanticum]